MGRGLPPGWGWALRGVASARVALVFLVAGEDRRSDCWGYLLFCGVFRWVGFVWLRFGWCHVVRGL